VLEPVPFALAATGCPPHAELAVSLAGAFHDVDAPALDEALDRLALCVPDASPADPAAGLRAVSELWRQDVLPEASPPTGDVDLDCLSIDRALVAGRAHPLVQALLAVEAGRRRGLALGLVSNGVDHCVAHTQLDAPVVVRVPDGCLADGRNLAPVLSWRCAHEACALLLDELEDRMLRCHRVGEALRAAELRLCLPIDDEAIERATARLNRVRARLN
jgi:hypothetical protein